MTTIHQAIQLLKQEGKSVGQIYDELCAGHDMADLLSALRLAGFDVGQLIQRLEGHDKPLRDGTM